MTRLRAELRDPEATALALVAGVAIRRAKGDTEGVEGGGLDPVCLAVRLEDDVGVALESKLSSGSEIVIVMSASVAKPLPFRVTVSSRVVLGMVGRQLGRFGVPLDERPACVREIAPVVADVQALVELVALVDVPRALRRAHRRVEAELASSTLVALALVRWLSSPGHPFAPGDAVQGGRLAYRKRAQPSGVPSSFTRWIVRE
jgi:hypothetical protein